VVTKSEIFHRFTIEHSGSKRSLAYSEVGDKHSDQILICIPGILETRDTFAPLLEKINKGSVCRAISVDLCGRGDSDPLAESDVYSMRLYFSDLELFLAHIKTSHSTKPVKIHILGTSMGGILAMYLATSHANPQATPIASIILNDVGLTLAWWSIYKLYGKMSKGTMTVGVSVDLDQLASSLGVSPSVVKAVQDPSHFDLPFKSDLMGMHFAGVLKEFKGAVSLIHAKDSVICTAMQVDEFLKLYPERNLLEVPNVEHPAPYNDMVCDFVIGKLIKSRSVSKPVDVLSGVTELIATPSPGGVGRPSGSKAQVDEKLHGDHEFQVGELPNTHTSSVPLQEQLPLFSSLSVSPVAACETVQKLVELNTQILDQFEQAQASASKVADTLASASVPLAAQSTKVDGNAELATEFLGPTANINQSVLNRWRSAVSELFRRKE